MSMRSAFSPLSVRLGWTSGTRRTKRSGKVACLPPRRLATALPVGLKRQASSSSMSTRMLSGSRSPSVICVLAPGPAAAYWPGRASMRSTWASIGARAMQRSSSVLIMATSASAAVTSAAITRRSSGYVPLRTNSRFDSASARRALAFASSNSRVGRSLRLMAPASPIASRRSRRPCASFTAARAWSARACACASISGFGSDFACS